MIIHVCPFIGTLVSNIIRDLHGVFIEAPVPPPARSGHGGIELLDVSNVQHMQYEHAQKASWQNHHLLQGKGDGRDVLDHPSWWRGENDRH